MALVSKSIPNLINGVSQQPPEIRLATQSEVQENGISSVANGLEKRPGTTVAQKILSSVSGSFHIHSIRRDEDESYTVLLGGTNGAASDKFLRVFDKDGNEMPVQKNSYASTPVFSTIDNAGLSYFTDVIDFSTDVKATTITDTTFYVSNKKTITKATADAQTSGQDGGGNKSSIYKCVKDKTDGEGYNERFNYFQAIVKILYWEGKITLREGFEIEKFVVRDNIHKSHEFHAKVHYEYLVNHKINVITKKENYEELVSQFQPSTWLLG